MTEDAEHFEPFFPHVAAFVTGWLTKAYARRVGHAYAWCPEWWQHFEAMSRLDALWRAWEYLRHDGAVGMSVWWRDHADPHMAQLLDPNGPFAACRNNQHAEFPIPNLPTAAPPPQLFDKPHHHAA